MERGTLNLGHNENFCMGGPGIILSRPTLKKVAPNVQQCLMDLYSTHEDVEVGRCVRKYARVSCTWAYEVSGPMKFEKDELLIQTTNYHVILCANRCKPFFTTALKETRHSLVH